MSIQTAWQGRFDFLPHQSIVVEPTDAWFSSDAGLLPLRQLDEHLDLTLRFAQAIDDPRHPQLIRHTVLDMVRARVYGILADYVDQNDHVTLRHDAIFKLIANRTPDQPELASQPTLSRFENAVSIASLRRLRDVFIDQFIASFEHTPSSLTFDIDAVDDPTHGQQQLSLFHGYYDQYQYFPSFITSADTDQLLVVSLRPGVVHAALGADDDLAYLVGRLRQAWPTVRIQVRGDAGYGVPWMYEVCERLGIDYTFGLASNAVLQRHTDDLLAQAQAAFDATGEPQRHFAGFWYQAGSWPHPRWVIVKAEVNRQGTNRRYIVSNRAGASVLPEATYDAYAQRGESENRNKELKCGLCIDRTSDHRFLANFFRLYLHGMAYNLLVRMRRAVSCPPVTEVSIPPETNRSETLRRRRNHRRRHDPLGEGQPSTWRSLMIKVAAEVRVSTRRVVVRLSGTWPHLDWYRRVCQFLENLGAIASG
jgi:hypothetical protein